MNSEAIAAMLREDRAEWQTLVAVLEAHPEENLHGSDSPVWTSRDVYAHLARWIDWSVDALEARLAGREPARIDGTDDEINARWQQEDSGLSLAEARERAQKAFDRRIQAIEDVPGDRWDAGLDAIAHADDAKHYASHRAAIVTLQQGAVTPSPSGRGDGGGG